MYDIGSDSFEDVAFVNISDNLGLSIRESTRICVKTLDTLYVVSHDNVTLLNCSPSSVD